MNINDNNEGANAPDGGLRLTREQKDTLKAKLDYLEQLEGDLAAGKLEGGETEKLLEQTLFEIDEIMKEGEAQTAHAQDLSVEAAPIQEIPPEPVTASKEFVAQNPLSSSTNSSRQSDLKIQLNEDLASIDQENSKGSAQQTLQEARVLSPQDGGEKASVENLNWDELNNLKRIKPQENDSKAKLLAKASEVKSTQESVLEEVNKQKAITKTKKKTNKGKIKAKQKMRVPTNRPKVQKKKKFPLGALVCVIVLAGLGFYYQEIIDYVKQQQAELAEKNKPKPVEKKEKPKPKPKPVVVEKPVEKEPEEPQSFFQPEENDMFKGELSHFSFNETLKNKCVSCHGAEGKEVEGDFNIARLMASKALNSKAWAKIYRSINKGEMPPPVEDEPDSIPLEKEEQELVLASIKLMFDDLKEGMTTRVLTPYEIQNTMGDLFDIDYEQYNPLKTLYQSYSDTKYYSHQRNILSPHYISRYYNILYDVLQSFIGLRPQVDPLDMIVKFPSQGFSCVEFKKLGETHLRWPQYKPRLYSSIYFEDITERKKTKQDRYLDNNENELVNKELAERVLPPGTYTLRFKASTENMNMSKITESKYGKELVSLYEKFFEENDTLVMPVRFYLEPPGVSDPFAKLRYLETIEISSEGEYAIEFTIKRQSALAYSLDWKSLPGLRRIGYLSALNKHGDKLELKHIEAETPLYTKEKYDFPMVKFSEMSLEGPYDVVLNPMSFDERTKINDMEVREKFKYLHAFNGMNFNVIYTYMFRDLRKQKMKMEDAYRNTMISFFLSPRFLIIDSAAKTLQDKLRYTSYVTHKSAPNAEFAEKYTEAVKKKDHKSFGDWLIKNDRFRRFSNAFTYQWLTLGQIDNNLPDEGKFKNYYRDNMQSYQQQEVEMFMMNMFRNNRPVTDLVNSDYAFLNKELMKFYRLNTKNAPDSGVFMQVDTSKSERGGILTSGAFLTATSNGVDPLPIRRAAWISENILDSPLPSPPDVDVNDFENEVGGKTLRERLEVHAKNPACHSCHKRLDSFAILMDKYDSIGHYNDKFSPAAVQINDKKITDISALKEYLSTYSKPMARAFTKKLLSFMLGREPGVQDEAKLDIILSECEPEDYRVGDIYTAILKQYFL